MGSSGGGGTGARRNSISGQATAGSAVLLAHVIQQSIMSREDTAEHSSNRVDIMAQQKVAAAIDNSI